MTLEQVQQIQEVVERYKLRPLHDSLRDLIACLDRDRHSEDSATRDRAEELLTAIGRYLGAHGTLNVSTFITPFLRLVAGELIQ